MNDGFSNSHDPFIFLIIFLIFCVYDIIIKFPPSLFSYQTIPCTPCLGSDSDSAFVILSFLIHMCVLHVYCS